MRVTYYGQACTLIEAGGRKILTDPWLTEGAYLGTWYHTHLLADAGVDVNTFSTEVDYLFISHEHRDHMDLTALRRFRRNIPLLMCKFATPRLRNYLAAQGFTNIQEHVSGGEIDLGDGVMATIYGTAEYTNDSALVVEHNGCRVFNETDCKLGFADLEEIGDRGVDLGLFMFSGANWYPMVYNYPQETQLELVRGRRRALVQSFVQRVKLMQPRFAVPSAGPCTVLHPDLMWLNTPERGIFIDPIEAIDALRTVKTSSQCLVMAATDVWDSETGFEQHSPAAFRRPRTEYLAEAAARLEPSIRAARAAEASASSELSMVFRDHFNTLVSAQTESVRKRINAKLAFAVSGPQGGNWTIDFSAGPDFVREGLLSDWTYKIEVEDKLLWPFVNGSEEFFEDLLLSLRFRADRRPDQYNEPLYHFLYDPDPKRLHDWYAQH